MKEIPKLRIYRLYENRYTGDDYEYREETNLKGMYFTRAEAEKEKTKLEEQAKREAGNRYDWQSYVHFHIKPEMIEKQGLEYYGERPDNFIPFNAVQAIKDACGTIRELYSSQALSLAYVNLKDQAKKHKHSVMEEVYFIVKGEGSLSIGEDNYRIEQGDTISIPQDTFHFLEAEQGSELEVLVVTHPKYSIEDVILEDKV
ncbi:cupin domain-containing protein [Candidatus Woesearchaeota archaeon]|nr:cupin domain-containing protein [Candidatus Woesearchaeota archaeon]